MFVGQALFVVVVLEVVAVAGVVEDVVVVHALFRFRGSVLGGNRFNLKGAWLPPLN